MLPAPTPLDEPERLRALERLEVLDSAPEREFDALVVPIIAAAAGLVDVPFGTVAEDVVASAFGVGAAGTGVAAVAGAMFEIGFAWIRSPCTAGAAAG